MFHYVFKLHDSLVIFATCSVSEMTTLHNIVMSNRPNRLCVCVYMCVCVCDLNFSEHGKNFILGQNTSIFDV